VDPVTTPARRPECPSWCRTDHEEVLFITDDGHPVREHDHRTARTVITYRRRPYRDTAVFARQFRLRGGQPAVVVTDGAMPDALRPDAGDALALAALVEALADATAGEHRKLAAAIRAAATAITPEEGTDGKQ
jgi:hypothetical protein